MQLLFLQQWLSDNVLKALSWTFVHSLWQGLIAAILAAGIIICTRKSTARLRYNLLGMVVIFFLTAALITFSRQLKNETVSETSVTPFSTPYTENPVASFDTIIGEDETTGITKGLVGFLNTNADLFVLIWAIFFLVNCMKLITGFAGVHRIRHYKTHPVSPDWQAKLNQLGKTLRIQQSVRLLQSELVRVPVAMGLFKPVILVPLGLLSHLPPHQVETILLHELAHIRRKDYLMNILQRFTEAVFFFNPALLWISSLIRQEREACCDDVVVANTHHKGNYLEALVSFHEYSQSPSEYAMAISTKRHYLLNRVRRMVTRENKKLNVMEKIFLMIGAVAVTAFTFIPKEESIDKKNAVVITDPAKTQTRTAIEPVTKNSPGTSAVLRKPVAKKVTHEPVFEVTVNIPVIDTIPTEKVRGFASMSTNVNDDGKDRKEVTTIIDNDGKIYSFIKHNNKVTHLTVDGKSIPENEFDKYADFFYRVDKVREENRLRKEKAKLEKEREKEKRELEKISREREKKDREKEKEKEKFDREKEREMEKFDKEKEKVKDELKRIEEKIENEKKKLNDEHKREKEKIKREEEKLKNEIKHEKEKLKREEAKFKDESKREKEKLEKMGENKSKEQITRIAKQRDEIARKENERKRKTDDAQRMNQKRFDEKMKHLEVEREKLKKEREKIARDKQDNKFGKQKVAPTTINGREVIRNETKEATKSESKTTEYNTDANDADGSKPGYKPKNGKTAITTKISRSPELSYHQDLRSRLDLRNSKSLDFKSEPIKLNSSVSGLFGDFKSAFLYKGPKHSSESKAPALKPESPDSKSAPSIRKSEPGKPIKRPVKSKPKALEVVLKPAKTIEVVLTPVNTLAIS